MFTYLGIIMAMSISFSIVIYIASAEQLERQMPIESYQDADGRFEPSARVQAYIGDMIAEGKQELFIRLYVLNLAMLVFGAGFSFVLARWTLEPIERNVNAQARFISDASHELKTPLTSIQATNEVALRRKSLKLADARNIIETNLEDVQRLQRMVAMLLELANDDRVLVTRPTEVHEIVSRAMTDVAVQAGKKDVSIDDQTKNCLVEADGESAAQALTALLDNAIKYSPEEATVVVTTRETMRGQVYISVQDQGPGISRREQQNIFDRFYRSDEARTHGDSGGYGLGLGIAKKIATAHHGDIECHSKVGEGSTFSLVLRKADTKKAPKKPARNNK